MLKPLLAALLCLLANISAANTHDVYFGTSGKLTKGIYHAVFDDETGKLSPANLVAQVNGSNFMAMDATQSHLYVLDGAAHVLAYKIEKDAGLTLLNSVDIGDGGGAQISLHPSGKFLLTAQYGGGSLAVFPIIENGKLGERSQLIEHQGGSKVVGNRQDSPHPHWTGYSPDGQYAFVPDLGLDKIVVYKIDLDTLTVKSHGTIDALAGAGPRHMRFSADGQFIYLLNELSLSVTTFKYDAAHGTATRLSTTQALPQQTKDKEMFNSSSEILVHPNGNFIYSANRGHDSVTVYHADPSTGKLDLKEVEAIRGSWPRNINLAPSGKWLLAAGAHSNTISVFQIDQNNGELTFQTNGIISVPGPICILFGKEIQ